MISHIHSYGYAVVIRSYASFLSHAEAVAFKVSTFLYGTADPEKLTAEQKDTVANIMSLAGAGVGAAVGNTSANAVSGSLNAESAVENNDSADYHGNFAGDRASISHAKSIYPNNSKNVELFLKGKNEGEALGAKQGFEDILNGILSLPQTILDNGKTFANSNGIIPLYLYIQVKQANDTVKAIQIELKTWQAAYEYAKIHDPYLAGQMYGMMSGRIGVNTTSLVLPTGAITQSGKLTKLGSLLDKQQSNSINLQKIGVHNPNYNPELNRRISNSNFKDLSHIPSNLKHLLDVSNIRSILSNTDKISKRGRINGFSIAVATVKIDGIEHNFLSLSGSAWKGDKIPETIRIPSKNGGFIDYKVIDAPADESILGKQTRSHTSGQIENNLKHAEMKLGSYLEQQFSTSNKRVDIHMAVQNTNPKSSGICTWGCQKTIPNLGVKNNNMNINLYHGHSN